MTDITYRQDKMFTRFYPETEAGKVVWLEMASKMDGCVAVLNFEANRVIQQIRSAGYKVAKAKQITQTIEDILSELESTNDTNKTL